MDFIDILIWDHLEKNQEEIWNDHLWAPEVSQIFQHHLPINGLLLWFPFSFYWKSSLRVNGVNFECSLLKDHSASCQRSSKIQNYRKRYWGSHFSQNYWKNGFWNLQAQSSSVAWVIKHERFLLPKKWNRTRHKQRLKDKNGHQVDQR